MCEREIEYTLSQHMSLCLASESCRPKNKYVLKSRALIDITVYQIQSPRAIFSRQAQLRIGLVVRLQGESQTV